MIGFGFCSERETTTSNLQALDNLAANQMRVDDFIDILGIDVGVPDTLGVDHQHGAFFAAVETTGLVDANLALAVQIELLEAFFGMLLRYFSAAIMAAWPAIFALIHAKKYVFLEIQIV